MALGTAMFNGQLGAGWREPEGHFRWMKRRGVVYMGGPSRSGQRLRVEGFCPRLPEGPVKLTVSVDGRQCDPFVIDKAPERFQMECALGAETVGKEKVEVTLEVDKPMERTGEGSELGMPMSAVSIR